MQSEIAPSAGTKLSRPLPPVQNEQVLSGDRLVPRLLLMQSTSPIFQEGKVKDLGAMVRSTTCEVLGDSKNPVSIIPLTFKNTWTVSEDTGGRKEWRRSEPRTPANEALPWEFQEDNKKMVRVKTIELFALLPQDIKGWLAEITEVKKTGRAPNLDRVIAPVLITFRSTSFKAGRMVANHFDKVQTVSKACGIPATPYAYTLELSCYFDKNEKGQYYVFEVRSGEALKDKELQFAKDMYELVTTKSLKVDEDQSEAGSSDVGGAAQF